jgi:hypothetical protein
MTAPTLGQLVERLVLKQPAHRFLSHLVGRFSVRRGCCLKLDEQLVRDMQVFFARHVTFLYCHAESFRACALLTLRLPVTMSDTCDLEPITGLYGGTGLALQIGHRSSEDLTGRNKRWLTSIHFWPT